MKALTLTQPWASLVALGEKRFETRSWPTSYRGRLAIHAAKGVSSLGGEMSFKLLCEDWDDETDEYGPFGRALFVDGRYAVPQDLPRGEVVAVAELVDVVATSRFVPSRGSLADGWAGVMPARFEPAFGDYGPERFVWVLDKVQRLVNPPPARGHQMLWDWGCLLDDVLEVLDGAESPEGRWALSGLYERVFGRGPERFREPSDYDALWWTLEAAVHALLEANLCGEEPAGYFFTDQRDPACEVRMHAYKTVPVA